MRLLEWIKKNKLSSLLLVVILFYFVFNFFVRSSINYSRRNLAVDDVGRYAGAPAYSGMESKSLPAANLSTGVQQERMVQKESSVSLLVKDVRESVGLVKKQAEDLGGFMIESNFSNPGESPNGSISVRVPSSSLQAYLDFLREQSIRVVSEQLTGTDITDQYRDINSRLDTLYSTKRKFEEIYDKAVAVQDILDVQNRIIELQDQIDNLKGQQQYMQKSSEMARVTIYLSTDELALPYAPDTSWRPSVVFKTAVRSLVENVRGIMNLAIWIGVYSVLWVPALAAIFIIKRRLIKK